MTALDARAIRKAALSLRGKRVVVAGLGLFGGGEAAVRYLVDRGADVLVTDLKSESELSSVLESLSGLAVEYRLGGHEEDDFRSCDLVVANPAMPFRSPYLQAAVVADVPVTSEIGLFAAAFPGKSVAVTGTSGKTTTTTLLAQMIANDIPDTLVGGNMGVSLLSNLPHTTQSTTAVLELSSFQLRYLGMMAWRPDISVVTNFAPNHLDVHDDLDDYRNCKQQLLSYQEPGDIAVLNGDDSAMSAWETRANRRLFGLGDLEGDGTYVEGDEIVCRVKGSEKVICGVGDLRIPGEHNIANACAATTAAVAAGVTPDVIAEVLATFEGVEHRLEHCGVRRGVTFYNDSIATSPERTLVALNALDQPIILIAGGSDKGLDYTELGQAIDEGVKRVVLIGETAAAIERAITRVEVSTADSLEEAVRTAVDAAVEGDAVLLSPASASYDMFANFEARGVQFKTLVGAL